MKGVSWLNMTLATAKVGPMPGRSQGTCLHTMPSPLRNPSVGTKDDAGGCPASV